MPGGKTLPAKQVEQPQAFAPVFDFTLPAEIKAGETFSIYIGSPDKQKPEKGNRSQSHVQRRRPFHLFIDPKGKGDFREPEIFA